MFSCIESFLASLGVRHIVLPAAEEAESIWTNKFGFTKISTDQVGIYLTIFNLSNGMVSTEHICISCSWRHIYRVPMPHPFTEQQCYASQFLLQCLCHKAIKDDNDSCSFYNFRCQLEEPFLVVLFSWRVNIRGYVLQTKELILKSNSWLNF